MKQLKSLLIGGLLIISSVSACNSNLEELKEEAVEVSPAVSGKNLPEDPPEDPKFGIKTIQSAKDLAIESLVRSVSENYVTPCGESTASAKFGRVKSKKSCGLTTGNPNIYTNQFAGILEGEAFWQARKDYTNYKTKNSYKALVNSVVDSQKAYRNNPYTVSEYPVGKIADLVNVYDIPTAGKSKVSKTKVILHRTIGPSANSAINSWTGSKNGSSHYLIDKNGTIYNLLPELDVAYHVLDKEVTKNKSGVSNANSIGIEVVGETVNTSLTNAQKRSVAFLTLDLAKRYKLKRGDFCPHDYVQRKTVGEGSFYYDLVLDSLKKWNGDTSSACKKIT